MLESPPPGPAESGSGSLAEELATLSGTLAAASDEITELGYLSASLELDVQNDLRGAGTRRGEDFTFE